MGENITDVVDPIFRRNRQKIRAKTRAKKAELVLIYENEYSNK